MNILEFKNITKKFDSTIALNNVSFAVKKGSITAICGENGSGKSTLMNILSGVYPYRNYEGNFYLDGNECKFKNIKESEKAGIVIIPQELALCPNLTIAENMFLGNEIKKHGFIDWSETEKQAYDALKKVGWDKADVTNQVSLLGIGKQQLVAIAKALTKKAKILILDEPTAPLNDLESEQLLNLLLELKKTGLTSIIISHKLNEIEKVADDIVVIRDGIMIEQFENNSTDFSIPRLIKGMVGREINNLFPAKNDSKFGETVFEIKNWTAFDPIEQEKKICSSININVKAGEIVGLSGLTGAGRSEMCLSFIDPQTDQKTFGEIFVNGNLFKPASPKKAILHGLYYVTEDRNILGLIKGAKIKRNILLSSLSSYQSKPLIMNSKKEIETAIAEAKELGVKTDNVENRIDTLSGGNAQKVLLGKALLSSPKILILDEPTKGVDIQAKSEIYEIIVKMAKDGAGILLISSEQAEIIGLSNRAYVMSEGIITAELKNEEITATNLLTYALGGNEK